VPEPAGAAGRAGAADARARAHGHLRERGFQWAVGTLQEMTSAGMPQGDPLAADSFLVREGGAIAAQRHRDRFAAQAAVAGPFDERRVAEFVEAGWALLAAEPGDWFPRFELASTAIGPRLFLRLRPAPPPAERAVLVTAEEDPRTAPERKGPDLTALAALRRRAGALGADEAVLADPSGSVVDGSAAAILWWRGEWLVRPDPSLLRLPSVTAELLWELAGDTGTDRRSERITPGALAASGAEVWLVNALHGIRPVTAWLGEPGPSVRSVDTARLERWRATLEALRTPLS